MIYLKTILLTLIITFVLASDFFISYYDIQYSNVWLIFGPIAFCILAYIFAGYLNLKPVNVDFFRIKLQPLISIILIVACVGFQMKSFSLDSLFEMNFNEIRENYIERKASIGEQLVPILLVYPLVHFVMVISRQKNYLNFLSVFILLGLLIIGFTTGGRQIFMQIILLLIFIKGKDLLFKPKGLIFLALFAFSAIITTIGRYEKENFDKVLFVETLMPANVSPWLIKENEKEFHKDILLEGSFYFGHQIPGFCNKVANIDWQFFPKYFWGMQPFIERQLIKVGVLKYKQEERFDNFKKLADNSGFFDVSWSTGFLDIYYNLSILGSICFFIMVPILLYNIEQCRILEPSNIKFKVLTAFNLLFIITFFMTPAISDTTIFFSYLLIYVSDSQPA